MPSSSRDLRDAIRRLVVAHGALDPGCRPCGTPVSTPWAWALLELAAGSMTVSELSERLNIDRTNVSRLARRMEDAGELERRRHPHDGRARTLALTEAGLRSAKALDQASDARFQAVLERLPHDAATSIQVLADLTHALAPPEAP